MQNGEVVKSIFQRILDRELPDDYMQTNHFPINVTPPEPFLSEFAYMPIEGPQKSPVRKPENFSTLQSTEAVKRIEKWNPEMQRGILLFGPVGTGKSAACRAIIERWKNSSYKCLFVSVVDAMQALRNGISDPANSLEYEEKKLLAPSLLVLDDLGAEKSTDWTQERLFTIFEKRAAKKNHTMFTTNLSLHDISLRYGARIHDRMYEFCTIVEFKGGSFRKNLYKPEI